MLANKRNGEETAFEVYEGDDPIGFVNSLNKHRRSLTPDQRKEVAVKLKALYEQDARERQRQGGRRGGLSRGSCQVSGTKPPVDDGSCQVSGTPGEVNEKIGQDLGVSARTIARDLKKAGVTKPVDPGVKTFLPPLKFPMPLSLFIESKQLPGFDYSPLESLLTDLYQKGYVLVVKKV